MMSSWYHGVPQPISSCLFRPPTHYRSTEVGARLLECGLYSTKWRAMWMSLLGSRMVSSERDDAVQWIEMPWQQPSGKEFVLGCENGVVYKVDITYHTPVITPCWTPADTDNLSILSLVWVNYQHKKKQMDIVNVGSVRGTLCRHGWLELPVKLGRLWHQCVWSGSSTTDTERGAPSRTIVIVECSDNLPIVLTLLPLDHACPWQNPRKYACQ